MARRAPWVRRSDRPAEIPVALPQQTEASRRFGGMRFSGFTVLIGAVLVLAIVILAPGLRTFIEQRQVIADLRAQVAEQTDNVETLSDEKARWSDASYIRAQSRARLFYVLPGEISYLVINDIDVADSSDDHTPISESIQTTEVDWLEQLYLSSMVAGLGTLTPDELEGSDTQ